MKKLKVVTVVGTRPEIIRLSCTLQKLDQECDHILVHTGQNYDYELNEIFFEDLGLRKPDFFLEAAGKNGVETIGNVIIEVDKILERIKPDALLVLGDTNSCISVLPAKRRKIPTFHMEAGNRCFDLRVPEEINRKIVDHVADINLTYSTIARDYLLREGIPPDLVIKTGSPMMEVLNKHMSKILNSKILSELQLSPKEYFLISLHREENVESEYNFPIFLETLNQLAILYEVPVIVSTHPRTRKKIESLGIQLDQRIKLLKPLGFTDYNKLQLEAKVVLSDSGTISEESSILNFPALNVREAHERPEGMEEAVVIMTGLNTERILQSIKIVQSQPRGEDNRKILRVSDYSMPNVSEKVVRILHSYTDYVNRVIWKKY